ncbi:MAG: hypothetical protein R2755_30860 [Acidimicrobiales bacterium]
MEYENSVHYSAGRLEALLAATQHRLIAIPSRSPCSPPPRTPMR